LSLKLLRNCVLLDPEACDPEPGSLLLEGERIASRMKDGESPPEEAERVDLGGCQIAPGFVDLHHHGSSIFAAPSGLRAALARDSATLLHHGTTAFLPTTVATPAAELVAHVEGLGAALDAHRLPGARALGIHLEGPWINAGAAGAQPPEGIRDFDPREAEDLLAAASGSLRMVTLAPELPGAAGLLSLLTRRDVVAALGHSTATPEQVDAAVEAGASHVTHLFNAMGGMHQRAPGLAGAALSDDRLSCDLICDGAHVAPSWVRVAARIKAERLLLITDRLDPEGAAVGFGSGELRSDGVALRLADGQLAGSCVTMARAAHNAVEFGAMTQLEAIAACTLRPARLLGLEAEIGSLRPGARADLAVLDADGAVAQTWLGGECVHQPGT
jgi:N-acetylglucosamine-6-phosphate deacetylase